jgi:transglutaminase superfamily protein
MRTGPLSAGSRGGVIDLNALSAAEPVTAQFGYWINDPRVGGVDLDGDPCRLTYPELVQGGARLLAMHPHDMQLRAGVARLHEIFASQATLSIGTPRTREPSLAIDLGGPSTRPGRSTAYGGLTISARERGDGISKIALPFPTARPYLRVHEGTLRLDVVDERGSPIAGALKRAKIVGRLADAPEKSMLMIEIDRAKLCSGAAHLRWSVETTLSDLRLDVHTPVRLERVADAPEEAKAWLQSAPMIQVEHPIIQGMAARARMGALTVQNLVRNTLRELARIRRIDHQNWPADFQNDALSFATTGFGECTAHANLFAAIMRANQVPCRIVNGISRSGQPLNMHYQNEYWLPGQGWVHVEPQGIEIQTSRTEMVETGIISPQLERSGLGFENYRGVEALTMIGMEIDDERRPLGPEERTLEITPGLLVRNSPTALGIHAAT